MKSNKEMVYNAVNHFTNTTDPQKAWGVSTQYLSKRLGIQRSNLSNILNQLVKEGLVEKRNGRPVLYRICLGAKNLRPDTSSFTNLIGYDGSLKNAIQLAKAAILYPSHCLNTYLSGNSGSGKSSFAQLMYHFALENHILKEGSPYIRFNCAQYIGQEAIMEGELFGSAENVGQAAVTKAGGGCLYIEHAELLPSGAKIELQQRIDNQDMELLDNGKHPRVMLICSAVEEISAISNNSLARLFPICIKMPPLSQRPMKERYELIQKFFREEVCVSKQAIEIASELLMCLLLYSGHSNIKKLRGDIRLACANAYARFINENEGNLHLIMSDFPVYVRTGYLDLKAQYNQVAKLLGSNDTFVFTVDDGLEIYKKEKAGARDDIYLQIHQKVNELRAKRMLESDINMLISAGIESEFQDYVSQLTLRVSNRDQLLEIVDPKIVNIAENFFQEAAIELQTFYPSSVLFGLCLHLNATIKNPDRQIALEEKQIHEAANYHKPEYLLALKLINQLEKAFDIRLHLDEAIFITMFLYKCAEKNLPEKPVVLIVMHGNGLAGLLSEIVMSISGTPIYAYDIPFEKGLQDAYQELLDLVQKIHLGKGILVIHDMSSAQSLLGMVQEETSIPIRLIAVPIVTLAIDLVRKCLVENDIEKIYNSTMQNPDLFPMLQLQESYRARDTPVILTICMTGEGEALYAKNFLTEKLGVKAEILSLALSHPSDLFDRVQMLYEKPRIVCIVSSFDPGIAGIPYVPLSQIYTCETEKLPMLLHLVPQADLNEMDFAPVFQHLENQFSYIRFKKIKPHLLQFIQEFDDLLEHPLSTDLKIGLLIHISCCAEQLKSKLEVPINPFKEQIIADNPALYHRVKESLTKIETSAGVKFGDSEISTIISIIKKSRTGE